MGIFDKVKELFSAVGEKVVETMAETRIKETLDSGSTSLDLKGLGLTQLPPSILQLSHLQELDLSENKITALPEALGQLTQLQYLDVSGNQLTALPEVLGSLHNCSTSMSQATS